MNNHQQRPGGRPSAPQGPKKGPKFSLSWIYAIIFVALIYMYTKGDDSSNGITKNINYTEFKEYVSKG